jgi:hypothetical protein
VPTTLGVPAGLAVATPPRLKTPGATAVNGGPGAWPWNLGGYCAGGGGGGGSGAKWIPGEVVGSPGKGGIAEVATTVVVGSLDVLDVSSCRSPGGECGVDIGGEGYPKAS